MAIFEYNLNRYVTASSFLLFFTPFMMSCSSPFETSTQYNSYLGMNSQLKQIRNSYANEAINGATGILVVFDVNNKAAKITKLSSGETKESAMSLLLNTDSEDPCKQTGPKKTIAAYLPPITASLPFEFYQCSLLRDQVILEQYQAREIRRLAIAAEKLSKQTQSHNVALEVIADDLAAIADTQDNSWREVIGTLEKINHK